MRNNNNLHHINSKALAGLAEHAQEVANWCINQSAQAADEVDQQMFWDRAMSEQAAANVYKAALAMRDA